MAVAAAAATAAAGGRPPGVAGVSRGIGGVTALPTRKYWPPRSKRFMEDTASWDDWAFSYSAEQERSEGLKNVHKQECIIIKTQYFTVIN